MRESKRGSSNNVCTGGEGLFDKAVGGRVEEVVVWSVLCGSPLSHLRDGGLRLHLSQAAAVHRGLG